MYVIGKLSLVVFGSGGRLFLGRVTAGFSMMWRNAVSIIARVNPRASIIILHDGQKYQYMWKLKNPFCLACSFHLWACISIVRCGEDGVCWPVSVLSCRVVCCCVNVAMVALMA